ncbi:MAG: hypothetical protein Q9174_002500, partial [Haloplaca sp. 1 TL-2023]
MLDYYLSDAGKQHLPAINKLAKMNTPEADDKLLHYAMEGIRLNGSFGTSRTATKNEIIADGDRNVQINRGDTVFCNF